ncbi:helix-turn-helix domain-containing protein [Paraburkholderia bannensis]|uniref:helix-turn-helix domain-containing protein n=1 Tax=Paraburkholderia bannensis TaxID=765414 RepID=UPI002ABE1C3C|nr:helix-turn-helix transcriptional regulator [Paraburkholderia bannensis]
MMQDPAFRAAYDALEEEFSALEALLTARKEAGLTQAQVAERMGTTTSAVSRLESSLASEKHSPSLSTLRKYAAACGKSLRISLV